MEAYCHTFCVHKLTIRYNNGAIYINQDRILSANNYKQYKKPKCWNFHAAHLESFMFTYVPCLDFPVHKYLQVYSCVKIHEVMFGCMFHTLKVFCMEKSTQDLDVNMDLSKCWFTSFEHLENSLFYPWYLNVSHENGVSKCTAWKNH